LHVPIIHRRPISVISVSSPPHLPHTPGIIRSSYSSDQLTQICGSGSSQKQHLIQSQKQHPSRHLVNSPSPTHARRHGRPRSPLCRALMTHSTPIAAAPASFAERSLSLIDFYRSQCSRSTHTSSREEQEEIKVRAAGNEWAL
jgi:hypothetical protein